MKKVYALMLAMGALSAAPASIFAAAPSTEPGNIVDVYVQNTTELSDNQLLLELVAVMKTQPAAFADKTTRLCVEESCETIDISDFITQRVETIGIKETIQPSQFAKDVGQVVGQAVGGVHGSASVKVHYNETTKKGPDGSSETSKTVDVTVTVSGGKK